MISRIARALMLTPRELLVLSLAFGASLPAVTMRLYSSDEVQYFAYLRSLWFDRDVSFENEYRYFYDNHIAQSEGFHLTFLELQTPAGRRINYGTLGCAILWSPFYGVADAGVRIARALGSTVPSDGYSKPYVAAVAYGSAFYGFASIVLSIAAVRRVVGSHALAAGAAVWVGTPLLFYMYVAPPFSHACSAFAVALFVTAWLHARQTWSVRAAIALGLSGALMAIVREQDVFFALGPATDFGITLAKTRRGGMVRAGIAGCSAFAVGCLPQILAYTALNGHPGPSNLVARKMTWYAPHGLQVLLDSQHGLFFWTPLTILALAGLVALSVNNGEAGRIGACALLMVALQAYVSGAVESWTVAGAFGQRRFVSLTILLAIGLGSLWHRVTSGAVGRRALGAAIGLCIWWNLALIAEFGIGLMDHQRLEWRRNAYDAFVTLPRMAPELAYRYFTNRSSFYRPATASGGH